MKKLKRASLLLLFAVVVGIFTNEYLLSNASVRFELALSSDENGTAQLYFYSGSDSAPIDEQHSMTAQFSASEDEQTIVFDLPLARLRMVRLDIDDAGSLIIHRAALSYMGKTADVQPDSITMLTDCECTAVDGGVRFVRTGDDPKIDLGDMRFHNNNVLYASVAAAIVVTAVLGAVLKLLQRKRFVEKYYRYRFLFEELVKRDFKKKYKRTVLGMLWSMLNPLLMLLVMWVVFSQFFGQTMNHYVIYLFAGNVVFSFFSESTGAGMNSLISNASIFTKVRVPKYMFIFSQNVTSMINFGLTLIIFFIFVAVDGIRFSISYVCLLYPIVCLAVFNIGMGMILSAMFVFFRDIEYLWSVFTTLLMYLSAIFYNIDGFPQSAQYMFLLNPVYVYIRYFRKIVLEGIVPTSWFHLLAAGYAAAAIGLGYFVYKKNNTKFLYYV